MSATPAPQCQPTSKSMRHLLFMDIACWIAGTFLLGLSIAGNDRTIGASVLILASVAARCTHAALEAKPAGSEGK